MRTHAAIVALVGGLLAMAACGVEPVEIGPLPTQPAGGTSTQGSGGDGGDIVVSDGDGEAAAADAPDQEADEASGDARDPTPDAGEGTPDASAIEPDAADLDAAPPDGTSKIDANAIDARADVIAPKPDAAVHDAGAPHDAAPAIDAEEDHDDRGGSSGGGPGPSGGSGGPSGSSSGSST